MRKGAAIHENPWYFRFVTRYTYFASLAVVFRAFSDLKEFVANLSFSGIGPSRGSPRVIDLRGSLACRIFP